MNKIRAWQMSAEKQPFELVEYPFPDLKKGSALVKIAGCGVCHTDLSFWHYGVPTRQSLPLVLGHEISGIVTEGSSGLLGQAVIVPAVIPCGQCDLCRAGRSNICQAQKMPGNDFNGGFASHITVPEQCLIPVPEAALAGTSLEELAVIADAVSTPYQVIRKSGLKNGDLAIIIGLGGVGIYAAQLAGILGGKVLALDISPQKLEQLSLLGLEHGLNINNLDIKTIKKAVKEKCLEMGAPLNRWKIYEMSGTRPGQELAFALLGIAGTLSIVGFTMEKLSLRLSNLMAFDAQIIGTWGCRPELYPEVIDLVSSGKLKIKPFTETYALSRINEIFEKTLNHELKKRSVLVPDFQS